MAPSRVRVWLVLTLLLMTNVVSALRDPFFDRVSGQWQEPRLESETDPPPVWRTPGTVEMLSFAPVMLLLALVGPTDSLPAPLLLARPPFVPPRT
jgi:hypothetical protein